MACATNFGTPTSAFRNSEDSLSWRAGPHSRCGLNAPFTGALIESPCPGPLDTAADCSLLVGIACRDRSALPETGSRIPSSLTVRQIPITDGSASLPDGRTGRRTRLDPIPCPERWKGIPQEESHTASEGLVLRHGFPWIRRRATHRNRSPGRSFCILWRSVILLDACP